MNTNEYRSIQIVFVKKLSLEYSSLFNLNSLVCLCWFLLHLFWFEDTLTEKQNSWSHICRRKLFSKCHRKMQKCKITGQGMCVNYASSNVLSNEKISEQFNSLSAQPLSVNLPPYIEYFYRSDERLRSALYCYCLRYHMK